MVQQMPPHRVPNQPAQQRRKSRFPLIFWLGIILLFFFVLAVLVIGGLLFGPRLIGWVEVPNFAGMPQDHAEFYAEYFGFQHKVVERTVEQIDLNNQVVEQLPQPGHYSPPGSEVRLVIARSAQAVPLVENTPVVEAQLPSPTVGVEDMVTPEIGETQAEPEIPEVLETDEPPATATASGPTPQGGGKGEIVFASDRGGTVQLWRMKADGSELVQLTDVDSGACQPAWSPDGEQLIYISPCADNEETYPGAWLWLMKADGSEAVPLPNAPGGDYDPAWSPDGSKVAFTSIRDNNRSQIYIMDMDSRTVSNLSNNSANEMQPDWSPDGKQLAYVSIVSGWQTIFLRELESGDTWQFSRDNARHDTYPVWTLTGEAIVYNQLPAGKFPILVAASVSEGGFNAQSIFNPASLPMRDVSFSPDGNWIVFESWPDGINHNIYTATASGGERQKLTEGEYKNFDPVWCP